MTVTLLNSFYDIKITKGNDVFTRDNYPIFFNSISKIHLNVRTGEIVTIDIELTPTFNDAIEILKSGLLGINLGSKEQKPEIQGKNVSALNAPVTSTSNGMGKTISGFAQIEVQLSRPGEEIGNRPYTTRWYKGALTQPDVSIQETDITITMKGYGNAVFATGLIFQFTMNGKTISDVVDACLDIIDFKKNIKTTHQASVEKKLLEKVPDQIMTDTPFAIMKWALGLQKLAFTEDLTELNTIIIYDTDVSNFKSSEPKYTFVQWRQVDLENNIYPLFSFNVDSARSLFLSGRAFGNYTRGLDEKKKEAITNENSEVKDDAYNQIENNAKSFLGKDNGKTFGWISLQPRKESTQQAQTSQNETVIGSSIYQKFSLETYGIPDIDPLDQVNMMIGDIKEFTGVLIVTRVSHTIDGNGWITSLEATKIGDIGQDLQEEMKLKMKEPFVSNTRVISGKTIPS